MARASKVKRAPAKRTKIAAPEAKERARRERFNSIFAPYHEQWNATLDEEDDGHIDPRDNTNSDTELPTHLRYTQEERRIVEERTHDILYRANIEEKFAAYGNSTEGKAETKAVAEIMAKIPELYGALGALNPFAIMRETNYISYHGIPDVEDVENEVVRRRKEKEEQSAKPSGSASRFGRKRKLSPKKEASMSPEQKLSDSIDPEDLQIGASFTGALLFGSEDILPVDRIDYYGVSVPYKGNDKKNGLTWIRADSLEPTQDKKEGDKFKDVKIQKSFLRSTATETYHPESAYNVPRLPKRDFEGNLKPNVLPLQSCSCKVDPVIIQEEADAMLSWSRSPPLTTIQGSTHSTPR